MAWSQVVDGQESMGGSRSFCHGPSAGWQLKKRAAFRKLAAICRDVTIVVEWRALTFIVFFFAGHIL